MGWNNALNQPTTAAKLDLQQIVNLEIDWCSFTPLGADISQQPTVNFDNLSIPSVATVAAAPPPRPTAAPPAGSPSSLSASSLLADMDDLTTASTIETVLSKILEKLDVLTNPPSAVSAQPVDQGTTQTHSTDLTSDTALLVDPCTG